MNATNIADHSVRAGMATQAAMNGSFERAIAKTTRHRSRRVLRRYIRPDEMFARMIQRVWDPKQTHEVRCIGDFTCLLAVVTKSRDTDYLVAGDLLLSEIRKSR